MQTANRFRLGFAALSLASLGFLTTPAIAAPTGTLNVANCPGNGVTVTASTVAFGGNCISAGNGTNVSTSFGNIIVPPIFPNGTVANLPVTPVTNPFMVFVIGVTNLNFFLTGTGPGVNNTVCANTLDPNDPSCSIISGSPFVLSPGAGGTTVRFAAHGTVSDANGTSNWNGTFSADFANLTPLAVRNQFVNTGTLAATTFAGSFAITPQPGIPEPTSLASLGIGLLLVGGGALRRRRRVV